MNTVQAVATIAYIQDQVSIEQLYSYLSVLQVEYPKFREWYFEKVIPETISGQRKILVASYEGKMAGVLILKDSIQKKICTLRVWPEFRKMGIGHQLMTRAIYELNDERPLITVSDDHVKEFSKLFLEYGFQCSQAYFGLYRKGHWEYVYNSTL